MEEVEEATTEDKTVEEALVRFLLAASGFGISVWLLQVQGRLR